MSKLRIRHVDPKTLNPDPNNPRYLDPQNRARLERIIAEFGLVQPIVVNTRTGLVVGGHQRIDIAIEQGLDQVPIVEVDLTDDQARALAVALNNPEAQGRWDLPKLAAYLEPLAETPTLELTGFDYDQFQKIQLDAGEETKPGREGQVIPRPDSPTAQPGDVYTLGRHILIVGDATDPAAYSRLPEPAQMTFTDPPYAVDYVGKTAEELTILNDAWQDEAAYAGFLTAAFDQIAGHTDGAIYVCYAITHAPAVHAAADRANIHTSSVIAWIKDRFVLSRSDYHWQWEGILYGWPEGKPHYWIGDRNQANVWETPKPPKTRNRHSNVWRHQRPAASRLHPTSKPVALVEHALRNSSQPGRWILDPFGGSGSTLAAAENLGRRCYTIELDPAYADVIIARWESLTGETATKEHT